MELHQGFIWPFAVTGLTLEGGRNGGDHQNPSLCQQASAAPAPFLRRHQEGWDHTAESGVVSWWGICLEKAGSSWDAAEIC